MRAKSCMQCRWMTMPSHASKACLCWSMLLRVFQCQLSSPGRLCCSCLPCWRTLACTSSRSGPHVPPTPASMLRIALELLSEKQDAEFTMCLDEQLLNVEYSTAVFVLWGLQARSVMQAAWEPLVLQLHQPPPHSPHQQGTGRCGPCPSNLAT